MKLDRNLKCRGGVINFDWLAVTENGVTATVVVVPEQFMENAVTPHGVCALSP